jgi:hypothetical protein
MLVRGGADARDRADPLVGLFFFDFLRESGTRASRGLELKRVHRKRERLTSSRSIESKVLLLSQ